MSARACSTGCAGSCGQGRQQCEYEPREAASACTELGFERSPAPRIPRLGAAGRRHCWVIKHQAWITAIAAMAGFALLVWAAK